MTEEEEIKEYRRVIMTRVRDYYTSRLGRYTHQRISHEWYFYGLGFMKADMTYVFGFNAGFFNKNLSQKDYTHVGANVLVRTNGVNPLLRTQFLKFFRHHMADWITAPEADYISFRGGVGKELPHYRTLDTFRNDDEIVDYIKGGLDGIYNVYNVIAKNPDNIFDDVVCSMNPYNESILDLTRQTIEKNKLF